MGEKKWIEVPTYEGIVRADYGAFIVEDGVGQFYRVTAIDFADTYEVIEE